MFTSDKIDNESWWRHLLRKFTSWWKFCFKNYKLQFYSAEV